MRFRIVLFNAIFFLILLLFTELLLRLTLTFYGYSFIKPSEYLYSGFYTNMKDIVQKEIRNDDAIIDILILGGSVVSTPWSNLEFRLDTILRKHYNNNERFAFYNIAAAGHTSLDNALKYKLLSKQRFDLVIYYEAINDNRANNINENAYFDDYSHIIWYDDIIRLLTHSEINITVIPFIIDKLSHKLADIIHKKTYISQEKVDHKFASFGAKIKTKYSFQKNLLSIISMAKSRSDRLLLLTYASYFPNNFKLTGQEKDMKYFAGCKFASPVTIWGKPENVKMGIREHNKVIRKLVKENSVLFFDMENKMPKDSSLFCDVCHVSEAGAQKFSHLLAQYIIDSKIFE